MKVGVVGTGYVGLVTAACLADSGHKVIAMDVDKERIARIAKGDIPIYEPGLAPMVGRTLAKSTLALSVDFQAMLKQVDVLMIAVGTPTDPATGAADMQYVKRVAHSIGEHLDHDCIVVNKSTVPVGSCALVQDIIDRGLNQRQQQLYCEVVSNPEFLKEGSAVQDFLKPDRIIIGCRSSRAEASMRELYQPFSRNHDKIIFMDPPSAELTKYAANCMLATKISFINHIAALSEVVGANIESVRHGIGSDPRIGYHFIYPGVGYGGSCFPKDVRALIASMREHQVNADLLEVVEQVNQRQKSKLFASIRDHYGTSIAGKTFAVWGAAFKPNTDDMREAPSLTLIRALRAANAQVRVYDPQSLDNCRAVLKVEHIEVQYCNSALECVEGANALILCTEWNEFRSPDWEQVAALIADKVVFDGRNLYINQNLSQWGLSHYLVGVQPRMSQVHALPTSRTRLL